MDEQLVELQEMTLEDVGGWCVHPGGPKILSAVENVLQLPSDSTSNSRAVLSQFGNMSSPTVLFIL